MRVPLLMLIGIGVLAIGLGAAGAPLVAASRPWSQPLLVGVLWLLVGWTFIGVGLHAWWRRPDNRVGLLMTAFGFAWFASGAWLSQIPIFHTIGLTVEGLYLAVLAHMLLAFPSGRLSGRVERAVAVAAYLVAVLGPLPAVLFLDTSTDLDGTANLLLVHADRGLAILLLTLQFLVGVAVVVMVAVGLLRRWRASSPRRRRALNPVFVTGAAAITLTGLDLAVEASYHAGAWALTSARLLALAGLLVVPSAFLLGLLRARFFQAGAVEALITRLSEGKGVGRLRPALATALGEDSVEVAYWIAEPGYYGDQLGRPVELPQEGNSRTFAPIQRHGQPVGAIIFDNSSPEQSDLVESLAGVAALAIENEQLEAELRARVLELERSRAQVLETAESERRRLERDLHDGVQQRLVTLQLFLGMARERLQWGEGAVDLLDNAQVELSASLSELRELARGIHPAVLANRGLGAAVRSLTARCPVPTEVIALPFGRLPRAVEATAYFVIAESLTNVAKHACASAASVRLIPTAEALLVEVADDGNGGADPTGSGLRGLVARVAAMDGRLQVVSPSGGGTLVRARIPIPPRNQEEPSC